MLFTSYDFILVFLPITLCTYWYLRKLNLHIYSLAFMVLSSLVFYGFWNPKYILLLTFSISVNYVLGFIIITSHEQSIRSRWLIAFLAISFNLCLLGYFKYSNFFLSNLANLTESSFLLESITLPLGISFYTFQQIAYIADAYSGKVKRGSFIRYGLFVSFFPQLIAGPIVHHKEMMPQFNQKIIFKDEYLAIGLTLFLIGLFKKTVLADQFSLYASPVFSHADNGNPITPLLAWQGALAYTLQLYFDFSAYSDMAIGLARMFGIHLPINFNSPYKAGSIIEFWRRWHITLSRFLRDYLYIPLGGNRQGKVRRYANLLLTMLLGGLWHGAGWNFVIWGGLHGLFLIVNHIWRYIYNKLPKVKSIPLKYSGKALSITITFLAVVFTWVYFRASTLSGAHNMVIAMLDFSNITNTSYLSNEVKPWLLIGAGLLIVFTFPNAISFVDKHKSNQNDYLSKHHSLLSWKPSILWAVLIGIPVGISFLLRNSISEFLYWQF